MNKKFFRFEICAIALTAGLTAVSCGEKHATPEWEWHEEKPDEPDSTVKPRYLWVDAAANFPDFADSKACIERDLTLAKDAGFTDIVVDVRPTNGDVLFDTPLCPQVEWLGAWVTGQGFVKITRTATWDYLQAFIDTGHSLGLRIHAAFNTMVGGNTNALGSTGVLFRDNTKREWATYLNTSDGILNTLDMGSGVKFFNPAHDEVQDYLCGLLSDLAKYNVDGIILDRGRFDEMKSDFSTTTRQKFEAYIGYTLTDWPGDALPAGTGSLPVAGQRPALMAKWFEFRAKVIHDFMVKARAVVKAQNPDIKFGVYVGGWYSSYYGVGVNWAAPSFDTKSVTDWVTDNYRTFGYADQMDQMLIGAYAAADKVYGTTEWTMQGFCAKAMQYTAGVVPILVGGPDVGNWSVPTGFTEAQQNQSIVNSVKACMDACGGYFLFDMIHLKQNGGAKWQYAKEGIRLAMQ
ncbi:MAG: family 10 glycosylhydrolase [Rikenellaceae bacterium]|jgi:uncharacterized lipoprotein YddW (UPF0748 family)|nr:family 10 glycosylhydrolase [Rikenellaceae bacterium]